MKILSIETSCDESAISIIEAKGSFKNAKLRVLANSLASQIKIHRQYGGVFPMLAKREHIKNLPPLLKKTLKEARVAPKEIDLVAVTYGPGLEPALWTGLNFARDFAKKWKKKLIPVNHMEGHIFSSLITLDETHLKPVRFPALALLISGGHTELVLVKKFMNYEIIGETKDDAVGEAFDKVARLLGLPYPGGPEISKLAKKGRMNLIPLLRGGQQAGVDKFPPPPSGTPQEENFQIKLPRPMLYTKDFDFSFSGLKTAVLYLIRDLGSLNKEKKIAIAKEFQDAVTEVLVSKTMRAVKKYKIKTLLIGGGVAANDQIRETLALESKKENIQIYFPAKELAVDNSIMISLAGYFRYISKSKIPKPHTLKACGNLRLE